VSTNWYSVSVKPIYLHKPSHTVGISYSRPFDQYGNLNVAISVDESDIHVICESLP
jgi:hypothetical protein